MVLFLAYLRNQRRCRSVMPPLLDADKSQSLSALRNGSAFVAAFVHEFPSFWPATSAIAASNRATVVSSDDDHRRNAHRRDDHHRQLMGEQNAMGLCGVGK